MNALKINKNNPKNVIQLGKTSGIIDDILIEKRIKDLYSFYGSRLLSTYSNVRQDKEIARHIDNLVLTYDKKSVDDMIVLIFGLGE